MNRISQADETSPVVIFTESPLTTPVKQPDDVSSSTNKQDKTLMPPPQSAPQSLAGSTTTKPSGSLKRKASPYKTANQQVRIFLLSITQGGKITIR